MPTPQKGALPLNPRADGDLDLALTDFGRRTNVVSSLEGSP